MRSGKASEARSNTPALAEDPASVVRKREPSSSPKASTSMPKGSSVPRAASSCTARMPTTTPSGPSYLPASITVSMCEPIRRRLLSSGRQCPRNGTERVLRHRHAGIAHPACDQIGGLAVFRAQEQADQPLWLGRDFAKLRKHRLGACAQACNVEGEIGCGGHRQCARSQRPICSRSSSVIWVWLPSGIALLRTVWIMMS